MIVQSWIDVLRESFYNLSYGVISFIPNFLFAVIIFIIGWVVGAIIGRLVAQVISAAGVDKALRAAGVETIVTRAGYKLDSGAFIGALIKWFIIIVFLLASLAALGLNSVTYFIQATLLPFLGSVIVASLILLVAAVIAELTRNVIVGAARAAGIASAGFVGALARWAIWIIAILAALTQIGIAPSILNTLFTGVVVALALAFGLAFGLGGQDSAARFLEKAREQMHNHHS